MKLSLPLVACAAAAGLPAGLGLWIDHETRALARALGERFPGQTVALGAVEAELAGTVRLSDVAVGDLFRAEAVEASVGATSLLSGRLRADEVRVAHPRLRLNRDTALPSARPRAAGGPAGRLRRIVVTRGELEVALGEGVTARATGVEAHPVQGGVRLVTGPVVISFARDPWRGEARFARLGADLELPRLRARRVVAASGELALSVGDARWPLHEVVVQHGVTAGTTRVDAVAEGGAPFRAEWQRDAAGWTLVAELPPAPVALLGALRPPWLEAAGTAGGRLEVRHEAGWRVVADLAAEGLALAHPALDRGVMPFGEARLVLDGTWDPARRQGRGEATVAHEGVSVVLRGERDEAGARLEATLPASSCAEVLAALPGPARAPLAGLALDGTVGFGARLEVPASGEARLGLDLALGCRALAEANGKEPARLEGAYRHTLPDGRTRVFADSDMGYVALSDLPRHARNAWVSAEDGRFWRHRGIDPVELERSFAADVAAGQLLRGGSTISQQLVKNLWLARDRTLARKVAEAVLTWRVEETIAKDRILELYLNLIELGDGVFGIKEGARRWFDTTPERLGVAQVAFLAAITPGPRSAERRVVAAGGLDEETRGRVRIILGAMRRDRAIDRETYDEAIGDLARLKLHVRKFAAR